MTTTPIPASLDTDQWSIDALDLDAYLERVGQPRAHPSREALSALHEAHVRTIPFENVDVALGRSPSLALTDITTKLVHSERGGYCFEHALLFAAVLERLGYDLRRCIGRVNPDHPSSPLTHMMLLVHLNGADWLADVGFGSGLLRPMPLVHGATTDHGGWPFRLTRHHHGWRLERGTENGWVAAHGFDDTPQRLIDYIVANHYIATHPRSPFTQQLIVQRLDHGTCRRLVGSGYQVQYADGRPAESQHVTPDHLGDVLSSLGITVTDADLTGLRRVYRGAEQARTV